ncbi:hypothetical protein CJ030_MR7G014314 [Morella rubra]|uniref:Uncharacterized protein n=1 Tax=Morella rubra TaxID=262757 RepID=A0A6A1V0I7_9ROSI|nr:hypothetical protein CJ030_MR7G014314 [Morella rubra]
MVPKGKDGSGWKELAVALQDVVAHLGKHKREEGVSDGSDYWKGISFMDVVKVRLKVDPSCHRVSKLKYTIVEGCVKLKITCTSFEFACNYGADVVTSKRKSFTGMSAIDKVGERANVSFWRKKLLGLREELDGLLNLIDGYVELGLTQLAYTKNDGGGEDPII